MKKLLRLMENMPAGMDAAVIVDDVNRRYYTEFKSSAGTLVVTKEQSYLIIDSRYFEAASEKALNCKVVLQDKIKDQVIELLKKHGAKNVGTEYSTLTLERASELNGWLAGFNIIADVTLSGAINAQREVKCPTEQKYIQASQDITDKTFEYVLSIIEPGKTEIEIALAMEFYSRNNGSEEPAFSFIVASGANTSRPHAVPTTKKLEKGELLLMDFGCTYSGYRSDMTRTVAIGEPSQKQAEVYNTVLESQTRAMQGVRAGVKCDSIHDIAANYINSTAYKGLFTHGLGHALGLDIHENPRFSPVSAGVLTKAGMVLSVEPGIYIPGEFGVRIEDIICITEDSFTNFTHSKKELIIL